MLTSDESLFKFWRAQMRLPSLKRSTRGDMANTQLARPARWSYFSSQFRMKEIAKSEIAAQLSFKLSSNRTLIGRLGG
jgi:hypothetical protein